MRLAVGSDHAANAFKHEIIAHVQKQGHTVFDFGSSDDLPCSDYPIVAEVAARAVACGDYDLGLLFCGTGLGMMLSANKVRGIRCAVCTDCYSASMSRRHNNANILALGARVLGVELAKLLVDSFLSASFDGGRHETRVGMIMDIETRESQRGGSQ